ncbi:Cytoskeletal signaling protein slm1 [Wickerhamiella sorbophila]|uniref:Cytoskeletal signaling protein slm1 n=1 Tax=Wickerhamiella sorbophila TaxID=45607 RepID=A0A2T0FL45_9ASCO|nr:Cytoskeletal signaling protein slm1 [Wickerhamiella sorbophila]PRT55713.1 Cytoskeletal signaling protein slm1 [Wickerhamiella sorbophila]
MRKSTSVKTIPTNVTTPAAFEDPKLAVQTEPSNPLNEFTDPSLLLVRRLEQWKTNISLILRYAESHASSQANLTSGLEKTRKIVQDQHPAGPEAEQQEKTGIDGVLHTIFIETEGLLRASEIAATNIRQSVIPPLEELLAEIDQHHREIKDNSISAMKDIEKLRIHTFKHMETLNGVVNSGAIPTENKDDPYIVRRQMIGVLNSQLSRENDHARNVVAIQTNFAKFEIKLVQTIQNSLKDLESILTEYNNASTNAHRVVAETYATVSPDQDWSVFEESNKDVFLPTTGFQRDPARLQFDNMDHIYTKAIVEGPLNRKARVLRSLQLGFYVLTPSGFFHGFKSEDAIKDPLPELSLFIPECDIEPMDLRNPDEFKVHGKDRSSKLGTRRNYVFRTLNAGDAQLWHEALLEVSHDITNASVAPVAPVPVAASSPSRGFASVTGTSSAGSAKGVATGSAAGRAAGAAGFAGAAGAVGIAAASRDRTDSRHAAGVTGEPESDETEVQSLRDPNSQFFSEEENERRSPSPLAATTAATTLGISPRMRAQSPFQSYRGHNGDHNGDQYGEPHHVEAHDDIVPMSLEGNNDIPSPEPLARKLDFEGEAKKTHAYSALADNSAAAYETNDFVEPNYKVDVEPVAPVTVETANATESLEPVGATAVENQEINTIPVESEPNAPGTTDYVPAVGDTPKDFADDQSPGPEPDRSTTNATPLGEVDYDVAKAVGIADAAGSGVSNETGFAEQKDILSAQGYGVSGLGTQHKTLEDDDLQKEATIRAKESTHQTSELTGHIDGESTTVFTESGEPVVVGKSCENLSGPYFSEPAGDPIFAGAGTQARTEASKTVHNESSYQPAELSAKEVFAAGPEASETAPKVFSSEAAQMSAKEVFAAGPEASETAPKVPSSEPAQVSAKDELVAAGAIPAKEPAEVTASDSVPVQAAKTATATTPAAVPSGPSAPPAYNKDLEAPAALKKTETTTSSASTTKSKRFSKRFMSKLKHGFRHHEKAADV